MLRPVDKPLQTRKGKERRRESEESTLWWYLLKHSTFDNVYTLYFTVTLKVEGKSKGFFFSKKEKKGPARPCLRHVEIELISSLYETCLGALSGSIARNINVVYGTQVTHRLIASSPCIWSCQIIIINNTILVLS